MLQQQKYVQKQDDFLLYKGFYGDRPGSDPMYNPIAKISLLMQNVHITLGNTT
jgi:hypothetical protein